MNLWIVFLTGLTTGGFSCVAVQGGLLTSVITNQKNKEMLQNKSEKSNSPLSFDVLDWVPVVIFLLFKLLFHTILGVFLGLLGSTLTLSLGVRLTFQVLTALFMFATAMNLLNIHPIFRYVVFQPPKFLTKLVKNSSKGSAFFTPAILGAMTIFVPCGVTQAMEVLAVSTGSPILGAMTMFFFVLGTSPLFAIIGIAAAKLSEIWNQWFLQIAALILIIMSLISINGVLNVLDFPITADKIVKEITSFGAPPKSNVGASSALIQNVNGVQKATITISNDGYSPQYFQVKVGVPVELTLNADEVYTCASSFTFQKYKIFEQLKPNESKTVTFTPTEKGKFTFSCSMGMYKGVMEVI